MRTFRSNPFWQKLQLAWLQRSRLLTITACVAAAEVALLLLDRGARLFFPDSAGFPGWLEGLGAVLLFCLLLLFLKWFRRVVMWRLRNRLVVTYVFIGVIPVFLLITMGIIAGYLFAGQFATFVISSDLAAQLKSLEAINHTATRGITAQLGRGAPLEEAAGALLLESPPRNMTVWITSPEGQTRAVVLPPGSPIASAPPPETDRSSALVADESGIHLRAWSNLAVGSRRLLAITSEPMDRGRLARIAAGIGEVTLHLPTSVKIPNRPAAAALPTPSPSPAQTGAPKTRKGKDAATYSLPERKTVRTPGSGEVVEIGPAITAGHQTPARGRWDKEVEFAMPFSILDWRSGRKLTAIVAVRTRLSSLSDRLFAALGAYTGSIFIALVAIGLFFALIEVAALIIGIRLTRTMTQSVAKLYAATEHVNRGDLEHRIAVTSQDQLAALETSFNSMTESLKRLFAEHQEKQRMEGELAIAQEVQALLFPQEPEQLTSIEVFGVCRPARTVSGDYYDFLTRDQDKLAIAVGDISGKGISAALLMATLHSAVRVYEFGRLPFRNAGPEAPETPSPAALLELLNHHLYRSTPAEKYATLFLGFWDGHRQQLHYSNGGHLPPLVLGQDGALRKLDCGGTVIGLFDDMQWEEECIQLGPGDLFLAYSDGLTEPENEFGEFGEQRLLDLVKENREQPLPRISEVILAAVTDWIGSQEQPDDITLVLARAK